ncbi:MAG: murein biosynthesis integral membrane protein MurJ [Alphaproteobacteria bacterium]
MSLFKHVFSVGSLTLLSRIVGFVRELLTANFLGAGPIADAFFLAFRLPNFFRRFVGEGAFSVAFVPKFSKILTVDGKGTALDFARVTFSIMAVTLFVFVIICEIFMPTVITIIAPGFLKDAYKFSHAVFFARITMPYLFFIALVALYGGVLNSFHKFAAFAFAPVLLNICLVISLLFLVPHVPTAGHALAYGVLIAGIVQLLWMMGIAKKNRAFLRPARPKMTPEVSHLGKLMIPGLIGAGVTQINIVVDSILASLLPDGSISYLYYADRLNQLPLGVIGIAIGTALLPMLTKALRSGKKAEANKLHNRALEMGLLVALPAAVGLCVLSDFIIVALFERGAFDRATSIFVAQALSAYAIGLPAYVLIKILAPGFYAEEDTKTPVQIAAVALIVNLVLNLILMQFFAHVGLALATSIAAWVNASLLFVFLKKRGGLVVDAQLKKNFWKLLFAAFVMGAALLMWFSLSGQGIDTRLPLAWTVQGGFLGGFWTLIDSKMPLVLMTAFIGIGAFLFFSVTILSGAINLKEIKGSFKK